MIVTIFDILALLVIATGLDLVSGIAISILLLWIGCPVIIALPISVVTGAFTSSIFIHYELG